VGLDPLTLVFSNVLPVFGQDIRYYNMACLSCAPSGTDIPKLKNSEAGLISVDLEWLVEFHHKGAGTVVTGLLFHNVRIAALLTLEPLRIHIVSPGQYYALSDSIRFAEQ